jgi:RNA polymerase sigma-70 factor, ECF subfamily
MAARQRSLEQTPEHDTLLFARIRASDVAAFETIFHRYVDRLCAFAFTYTQSRDTAEEVVQDVFVWLWEHRSAVETPSSVAAYLHSAVRHRALNLLRSERTELRIYGAEHERAGSSIGPASFEAADAAAEARDLEQALASAVAAMSLRCREVFTLARGSHMTYAQIAGVLGLSPKTVEIHMSRALAFLRERLALWLPEKS